MQIDKDLVATSATPLVLGILADGDSYGYAILKRVNQLSGGRGQRGRSRNLYPLLHRLERLEHVSAQWAESSGGRKRKHYAITATGREALAERRVQWTVVAEALDKVWQNLAVAPPVTSESR